MQMLTNPFIRGRTNGKKIQAAAPASAAICVQQIYHSVEIYIPMEICI